MTLSSSHSINPQTTALFSLDSDNSTLFIPALEPTPASSRNDQSTITALSPPPLSATVNPEDLTYSTSTVKLTITTLSASDSAAPLFPASPPPESPTTSPLTAITSFTPINVDPSSIGHPAQFSTTSLQPSKHAAEIVLSSLALKRQVRKTITLQPAVWQQEEQEELKPGFDIDRETYEVEEEDKGPNYNVEEEIASLRGTGFKYEEAWRSPDERERLRLAVMLTDEGLDEEEILMDEGVVEEKMLTDEGVDEY